MFIFRYAIFSYITVKDNPLSNSKPRKPLSSEELVYVNELIKIYTKQSPQQSPILPVKSLKGLLLL